MGWPELGSMGSSASNQVHKPANSVNQTAQPDQPLTQSTSSPRMSRNSSATALKRLMTEVSRPRLRLCPPWPARCRVHSSDAGADHSPTTTFQYKQLTASESEDSMFTAGQSTGPVWGGRVFGVVD